MNTVPLLWRALAAMAALLETLSRTSPLPQGRRCPVWVSG